MNANAEMSKHLIAELFIKTGELLKGCDPRTVDEIMGEHDNHLVALMNVLPLIMRYPRDAQPLRQPKLGLARQLALGGTAGGANEAGAAVEAGATAPAT